MKESIQFTSFHAPRQSVCPTHLQPCPSTAPARLPPRVKTAPVPVLSPSPPSEHLDLAGFRAATRGNPAYEPHCPKTAAMFLKPSVHGYVCGQRTMHEIGQCSCGKQSRVAFRLARIARQRPSREIQPEVDRLYDQEDRLLQEKPYPFRRLRYPGQELVIRSVPRTVTTAISGTP